MKNMIIFIVLICVVYSHTYSQFKTQTDNRVAIANSMVRQDNNLLFGWIDLSKVKINHSYSLNYTSFAGRNVSIGALTSSFAYQLASPLSLQFDISLIHSPYNNLGANFGKSISGLYLTRAELNYKPSKNTLLQIQFQQIPTMYWMNSFNNYNQFRFLESEDVQN